jgi:hypothetical protein
MSGLVNMAGSRPVQAQAAEARTDGQQLSELLSCLMLLLHIVAEDSGDHGGQLVQLQSVGSAFTEIA